MNTKLQSYQTTLSAVALLIGIGLARFAPATQGAEAVGEFSKPVIDIGIVVRDADRSANFLTNAIGFQEVKGFSVTGELGRKIGLIDGHPVTVRMFVLAESNQATHIKILSFPQVQAKKADQAFIHSTLGIRYLTLYVTDIDRALERLKKANIPLLGESPVDMGGGTFLVTVKDPDGNFIELIGPRH